MNDDLDSIIRDFTDCVTSIEPKQQGQFPDPVRFPPPLGKEINCGCLATIWEGDNMLTPSQASYRPRDDQRLLLECVWYPLWDTYALPDGRFVQSFFQLGTNGRSYATTNTESAGQLYYPMRMHVWEIEFQFDRPVRELDLSEALVTFLIGEKNHFMMPLMAMHEKSPSRFSAALCTPLLIPSVQNFRTILDVAAPRSSGLGGKVRCVLHGYLHRSIP